MLADIRNCSDIDGFARFQANEPWLTSITPLPLDWKRCPAGPPPMPQVSSTDRFRNANFSYRPATLYIIERRLKSPCDAMHVQVAADCLHKPKVLTFPFCLIQILGKSHYHLPTRRNCPARSVHRRQGRCGNASVLRAGTARQADRADHLPARDQRQPPINRHRTR
jgi:hypothetical protein